MTFADAFSEDLFNGTKNARTRSFPQDLEKALARKFFFLTTAKNLIDLRVPPGNRLEALKGDLDGFHSIRINDQWRIVFRWTDQGPADVRVVDYH